MIQLQRICQLDHVIRPIQDLSITFEIGETGAWTINCDNACVQLRSGVIVIPKRPVKPCTGEAMTVEDRLTLGSTVFNICQSA